MPERDQEGPRARVGTELDGGLRLSRLLAVGAVGAVYVADGHPSGIAAVKLIHPELRPTLEMLTSLRVADDVAHPQVVAPVDFIGGALPGVVMPLIFGESASQLAKRRRGRIPPSEALRIALELVELVGTAHARDVCHGALSLSHVLLDDRGSVHVIGFGEARLRVALGVAADRAFAAPEQEHGAPSVSGDLWGVAAVLFALMTDQSPRELRDPERVRSLENVTSRAPRDLVELLDRALAIDPGQRFADAGTLRAAMKQASDTREVMYAHPLASALASESGSHAMLDPARLTQPPQGDPSWSSVPPASPQRTPSSMPASRSPSARNVQPVSGAPPPAASQSAPPPPSGVTPSRRSTTPPRGAPRARRRTFHRAALPADLDPLAVLAGGSALAALRDEVFSGLELRQWRAAPNGAPLDESSFDLDLAVITAALAVNDESTSALAHELAAVDSRLPDRLLGVIANSLEGAALAPTLAAFGPALRDHLEAAASSRPAAALDLLVKLGDSVRAPPAMLLAERQRVLAAVAPPELVRSLFARLGVHGTSATALDALGALLPALGPEFAAVLANTLVQISDLSLHAKVRHHLESELTGHERALGELAREAEPSFGVEVVRLLVGIETLASLDALKAAAQSRHPAVRIEALGSSGSTSEALRLELKARLEDGLAIERIHVLRALTDHEVRCAAPFVALRLKSAHFDGLEIEERRALFHALAVLAPARAEAIAIEILGHKKLLSLGAHEETRALAAATLGEIGKTDAALETLTHHAGRHLGTSDRVRRAALVARDAVQERRANQRARR